MIKKTKRNRRIGSCVISLLLLSMSIVMARPAYAGGGNATATPTASILILQKIPLSISTPVALSNSFLKYSTLLTFSNELNASLDVQSPPSIPLGESQVINLQIKPSTLQSKSSQIRAKLNGVNFQIADDGQPDKTLAPGTTVNWSWVVSSNSPGNQALLLSISYLDQKGDVQAQWENMPIHIEVSSNAPSPTPESVNNQIIKNLVDNTATLIGVSVTLILGLVGLYLQYGRKGKSDTKK